MSRVHSLTSLRFIAAMMVVAHHYWGFEAGYAGVGFFFVLSGYVLALNYEGRVGTWAERQDFWFRRFARIYPTHLLTFLFALPLGASLATLPANLALLQSWIPVGSFAMSVNKPSWSISNEAFFYALFPLLLGIRWRTLALWGAGLLALALLWPLGEAFTVRGLEIRPTHWFFYVFPPVRLFEFALGVALVGVRGKTNGVHEVGAIALAAASILALPLLKPSIGWAIFFIPASAALVYVFARGEGPISRLLSNRWLVLLGDASFMLYMIHWPLMHYLGTAWWVAALAVALSVALFLWFEKPAQRKLLGCWNSRRKKIGCGTIVA